MVDRDVSDQIGVDIGGAFTDCVLIGTDGRGTGAYASAKALSMKDDPVDGVMAGLEKLAANVGLFPPYAGRTCDRSARQRPPRAATRRSYGASSGSYEARASWPAAWGARPSR
jgi:Hydantoinase/oxoprolinase N-terminal region